MLRLWLISILFLSAAAAQESGVRKVLTNQQAAWNRGDVAMFMEGYENSNDTTFVGKTVQHGYLEVLESYKKRYPTPAAMGKLEFSDIEVKMLGTGYASVLGKFHLTRTAEGGGDAAGIFTLLFAKTPAGWKIILDHTS